MKTCDAILALEDCCKSMIFDGYGTLCSDDLREIAASYRKLAEREKALTEALEPFARLLDTETQNHDPSMPDSHPIYRVNKATITLGDLRCAAALALHKEDA